MTDTILISVRTRAVAVGLAAGLLGACQAGSGLPGFLQPSGPAVEATSGNVTPSGAARLVERDVEAPEVFATTEDGLWDGRPSLGGVWVAHPDATDPERVFITNLENGQTVVGALFRRERELPGPELQISSDAAAAINVIAGQPTELRVVALRTIEEPEPIVTPAAPVEEAGAEIAALPTDIIAEPLDPIAAAEAALGEAELAGDTVAAATTLPATLPAGDAPETGAEAAPEAVVFEEIDPAPAGTAIAPPPVSVAALLGPDGPGGPRATEVATDAAPVEAPIATALAVPAPAAGPAPQPTTLDRPFIQVAVFTDQENADQAGAGLRSAGLIPTVFDLEGANGPYWRILVGPARDEQERAALLESVRGLGYEDAYFVTN